MGSDQQRILWAQAARAFAYGFGAVLLGATLAARGWSDARVGALLALVLAGSAAVSLVVGTWGDRIGRRRSYIALYGALGVVGVAFAFSDRLWVLGLAALTGAMSTEVIESGPFTSLELAMLAEGSSGPLRTRVLGVYNAAAALAGSLGALAVSGPLRWRGSVPAAPPSPRLFLGFVVAGLVGAWLAVGLSPRVEPRTGAGRTAPLLRSRREVLTLSGLFAVDSFAGGFVIQSFVVFYLVRRFGASTEVLGIAFFLIGLAQTGSFLVAPRLAERFGLLNTMVFTHLPSNLLLAGVWLAPSLAWAVGLLLARASLSQMDVPTRQGYLLALVAPEERTAATAYTNAARLAVRPLGPLLAGVGQALGSGIPFLVAGVIKAAYDLTLWAWFRRVPLTENSDPVG